MAAAGRDQFPVGMRVLAVDDDPVCLKVLETLLRRCQYHGENLFLSSAAQGYDFVCLAAVRCVRPSQFSCIIIFIRILPVPLYLETATKNAVGGSRFDVLSCINATCSGRFCLPVDRYRHSIA